MASNSRRPRTPKPHLVILADNLDEIKKKHSEEYARLRNLDLSIDTFTDGNLFIEYIFEHTDGNILLIVRGAIGKEIMAIIHDNSKINSIYVFCTNKAYHQQWAKDWTKIKGVFDKINVLCTAVEQAMQAALSERGRSVTPESNRRTGGGGYRHRPIAMEDQQRDVSDKHRRRGRSAANEPSRIEKKETRIDPIPNRKDTDSALVNSLNTDDLQRTLIATTERTLRQSLLVNQDQPAQPSIDTHTVDQLQTTLMQTIQKHVTKKSDDSEVLNRLFSDLKQVIVDTLVQQQQKQQPPPPPPPSQPVISEEMIKKTVLDIISEQNKVIAATPSSSSHPRPTTILVNREVKITANRKQTRVGAEFRQERDAVVSNQRLRDAVQQWSTVSSMSDLVASIKKHGQTNLEYAWLLFCWIGQNIRYQAHCNVNSAENVFRRRQGVCRGFVSLYHECCTLLGIECTEISGYAKTAFFKPGESLQSSAHAWNSIVLDNYTYLVDPTWGAGGRDNDNKLEDFYFLTSPEELIYTHYCDGSQLLEPEISKKEFLSLPIMKSNYYRLGLTLLSPKQGFNETNQNLFKISIRAPENVDILVELKVNDTEYPRALHTFYQRDENQSDIFNCFLAPPVVGLYQIHIYAKLDSEKTYPDAINMRLRIPNMIDAFTFPRVYSTFSEHKCILIAPFNRLIYMNTDIVIHMIIPHANVVKIRNGDDYTSLIQDDYRNGVLKRKIRVQGNVQVCARWDDNADTIQTLCVFDVL